MPKFASRIRVEEFRRGYRRESSTRSSPPRRSGRGPVKGWRSYARWWWISTVEVSILKRKLVLEQHSSSVFHAKTKCLGRPRRRHETHSECRRWEQPFGL